MLASMGEFYQAIAAPIAKVDEAAGRQNAEGGQETPRSVQEGRNRAVGDLAEEEGTQGGQGATAEGRRTAGEEAKPRAICWTRRSWRDVGGGVAVIKGRQGTGDDAAGNVGGRQNTDNGKVTEANMSRAGTCSPPSAARSAAPASVSAVRRRRTTRHRAAVTKARATNAAEAGKLNMRASALFKAQWNGLLAGD
jgi:hypothetical protein